MAAKPHSLYGPPSEAQVAEFAATQGYPLAHARAVLTRNRALAQQEARLPKAHGAEPDPFRHDRDVRGRISDLYPPPRHSWQSDID